MFRAVIFARPRSLPVFKRARRSYRNAVEHDREEREEDGSYFSPNTTLGPSSSFSLPIIAIQRGTIPRNRFSITRSEARETFSTMRNYTLRTGSRLRRANTRPDRGVVDAPIKTTNLLLSFETRQRERRGRGGGGETIKAGSVYSNAWNRSSWEYSGGIIYGRFNGETVDEETHERTVFAVTDKSARVEDSIEFSSPRYL